MTATQQRAARRVGVLEMASPDPERLAHWEIFRRALAELGHVEGDDIAFDFRWADGQQERMASAAADLVRAKVDVLVTAGTPAAAAAIRATGDIPIIMATGVGLGTQLTDGARPASANVTGISDLPPGVSARRIELLREAFGHAAPLAMLADRANPSSVLALRETQEAAVERGIDIRDYWLAGPEHLSATLAAMKKDGIGGFVIAPGAMFFAKRRELAALAREHRLASMSVRREYAEAGCLMAYGASLRENYRRAAVYVSRVLNGTKPADLPIDEPTEFDFVVNLATARAIGCALPPSLLAGAEIIEA
jgi:putative tryptophan/tyrosine transport system substrate-binding protein